MFSHLGKEPLFPSASGSFPLDSECGSSNLLFPFKLPWISAELRVLMCGVAFRFLSLPEPPAAVTQIKDGRLAAGRYESSDKLLLSPEPRSPARVSLSLPSKVDRGVPPEPAPVCCYLFFNVLTPRKQEFPNFDRNF